MRISSLAFSSNILCASPAKIFAAVVAIFFSAQLAIPLSPVPVTFQDSVILVLAFFLPLPELCWAVMCYLFLGALGLPIFAEFSGGVTVAFGLTGGYLWGFLPAALVANYLFGRYKRETLLACFLGVGGGTAIIFFCGIAWLVHFIGFRAAIDVGLMPFLLTESIKWVSVVILLKVLPQV